MAPAMSAAQESTVSPSAQTSPDATQEPARGVIDTPIDDPDAPLYSPFTARYLLDEIRNLRSEFERSRAQIIERQITREYNIAHEAAGYARNAVELFFFVITAVMTLLVFLGWNSLRDVRNRINDIAEAKVGELVEGYAERLNAIEQELHEKSEHLLATQREIDDTNEIHSLWLRASQETTPAAKIAIYDEILRIRPDDTEALTFKADAALELEEPQWALSLTNRAIKLDPDSPHALYQRACAYAAMEMPTEALADLETVIGQSENYRETARTERAFTLLHGNDVFEKLVNPMELAI